MTRKLVGSAALLLALSAALSAATSAVAQGRLSTTALTCARAAGIVRARGGVVLGTGGQTFDRFVSDRRFCEVTEITVSAFVPTRDDPRCFVGYRCKEPSRDDLFEQF